MSLPRYFCWTRFGTEAGEEIDAILLRKENERVLNGGIFLWGIGSAIGPSMRQLVRLESRPPVIFSPIRSAPRQVDVAPESVVCWTSGVTLGGRPYELPAGSMVTSRAKSGTRQLRHYALVCASSSKLLIDPQAEKFEWNAVRNLLTNRPVGASQVTAIVRRMGRSIAHKGASYSAAIQAELVFPYLIELTGYTEKPLVSVSIRYRTSESRGERQRAIWR
jgi:hypothetical protein